MHDTGIHHLRLLHLLGRLAVFMFLPVWLFYDLWRLIKNPETQEPVEISYFVMGLLFLDGMINWFQNIIAFSVLSIVTPLTYAVASASKRIFVIAASLFILGNPVTWLNLFGMTMAISGVLCYNKAKYDQRHNSTKETALPKYYNSENNSTTLPLLMNGWTDRKNHLFAV